MGNDTLTLIRQAQAQGTENRGDERGRLRLIQTKSGLTGKLSVLLFIRVVGGAFQLQTFRPQRSKCE